MPNPRTPRTYPQKLFVVTAIPKGIIAIPNNSILIPFIANTSVTNLKLFYLRSINPMIEKINPTIPIPITSSPIPDEQREIIMAKSSIAIPNPIFFIVNHPLQMPICCHLHYTSLAIEKIAYFMKLVGWEQLATQGVPRWQVHKRVAGGSQRRGSVASPV